MWFEVSGLGFGVLDLGFKVGGLGLSGLEIAVWGLGSGVSKFVVLVWSWAFEAGERGEELPHTRAAAP